MRRGTELVAVALAIAAVAFLVVPVAVVHTTDIRSGTEFDGTCFASASYLLTGVGGTICSWKAYQF